MVPDDSDLPPRRRRQQEGDRVTLRELLEEIRDSLGDQIREAHRRLEGIETGVLSVNVQLREQNGRIGKGEVNAAEMGAKIKNLEREVFHRRRRDDEDVDLGIALPQRRQSDDATDEQRAITRRDVRIALGTVAAVFGALAFFQKVVPALAKVLQP